MYLPFLMGIEDKVLTRTEISFIREYSPVGVFLYDRNIGNPDEMKQLTRDIRGAFGFNCPIFTRFGGGEHDVKPDKMRYNYLIPRILGEMYEDDPNLAARISFLLGWLQGIEFKKMGVNVLCGPTLDIAPTKDNWPTTVYHYNAEVVAQLGRYKHMGFRRAGLCPAMGNALGLGRLIENGRYKDRPLVEATEEEMEFHDFLPFQVNVLEDTPMLFMGDVMYSQLDDENLATFSPKIINNIIRHRLGYDGFIISDNLHADAYGHMPIGQRAQRLVDAGVDIIVDGGHEPDTIIEIAGHLNFSGDLAHKWDIIHAAIVAQDIIGDETFVAAELKQYGVDVYK